MKKSLLIFLFISIISLSHSQSSIKGSHERTRHSFFKKKLRKQMNHFNSDKKDLLLNRNGTSYRRDRKIRYKVDGDGFLMPTQGKRNKNKTK